MIPLMIDVLHMIDRQTPRDGLLQLGLLVGGRDVVASVGPAPPGLNVPVRAYHAPLGSAVLCGRRMAALAARAKAVHAWGLSAGRAAVMATDGRPIVCTLATAPAAASAGRFGRSMPREHVRLTLPTEAARRRFVSRGGCDGQVVVLPPPAAPISDRAARRRRTRKALGLTDGHYLIAAPGEMGYDAGQKYASWAHAILRRFVPHARLILPGRGPNRENVRTFVGTLGFSAEQYMTGDRFALPDVLAAADAAIFLPRRDGGVAALAAAMAAELPIVVAATDDVVECVGRRAALRVPVDGPRAAAAAMVRLMEDSALAAALAAEAGRTARERFSVAHCRRVLEPCYAGSVLL